MASARQVIEELVNKFDKLLQKEQKIADVRALIEQLVKEGILQERERKEVEFDPHEGRAGGVYASVGDAVRNWSFTAEIANKLIQVAKYLNKVIELWIQAPPDPVPTDQQVGWEKTRPRLENLGFTVSTYEEEGQVWIDARLELAWHGQAVAYLRVRDSYAIG